MRGGFISPKTKGDENGQHKCWRCKKYLAKEECKRYRITLIVCEECKNHLDNNKRSK